MPPRRRRVRDKWRMKDWYALIAPTYFGGVKLGSVPCTESEQILGRTIEATLYDLTGDFAQQHQKLYFQVTGVEGKEAHTIFKGHEYARDYLRSLVRRGSTRVDSILNLKTKDGYLLRASVVVFTLARIKTSQIKAIRLVVNRIVQMKAVNLNFDQFVQEAVLGKIASDIYNEAKAVTPLRHVGFRKSKVLGSPSEPVTMDVVEVETEPPPEGS